MRRLFQSIALTGLVACVAELSGFAQGGGASRATGAGQPGQFVNPTPRPQQGVNPAITPQGISPAITPQSISPAITPQGVSPVITPGQTITPGRTALPQGSVIFPPT